MSSAGEEADSASGLNVMTRDGRYVAFNSGARNFVHDLNATDDVFLHDTQSGKTWRMSEGTGGIESNGPSSYPSLSDDARWIVFSSWATNLVPNDTNHVNDVFLRDRLQETTVRLSEAPGGVEADGGSYQGAITGDGRFVVFLSFADNLVPNDTNDARDVFLLDRSSGVIERESVSSSGAESDGAAGGNTGGPVVSTDGRWVVFSSRASNLDPADTNGLIDVYMRDRALGTTRRLTLGVGGAQPDDDCDVTSMTPDGRFVAVSSNATNLVPNDTNGVSDAFVIDVATGAIERVSVSTAGGEGSLSSWAPVLSDDGRFAAFSSAAPDISFNDINNVRDVFVHDRVGHTTELVSNGMMTADADCNGVAISGDGGLVAFSTASTQLVPNDTNNIADAFLHGCYNSIDYCIGTNSACPCGNGGYGPSGCANPVTHGVSLQTLGQSHVSADTLTLIARDVPPSSPVLFLQGLTQVSFVFGDGLRCVGGATIRLGLRFPVAGHAEFGSIGTDPSLSVIGSVPAGGDYRYYQAWYRSPQPFCTPSTFNLSNGAEVVWSP